MLTPAWLSVKIMASHALQQGWANPDRELARTALLHLSHALYLHCTY